MVGVTPRVGRAGGGGGHALTMGGYAYRLLLVTLSLLQQAGVIILKYNIFLMKIITNFTRLHLSNTYSNLCSTFELQETRHMYNRFILLHAQNEWVKALTVFKLETHVYNL